MTEKQKLFEKTVSDLEEKNNTVISQLETVKLDMQNEINMQKTST